MGNTRTDSRADREEAPIKPVEYDELPEEFKNIEKPLGLELHVYNIIQFGIITQGCMIYGLYLWAFGHFPAPRAWVVLNAYIHAAIGGLSITVGCHRYWTHKTFKASKPFQILLMLMQTMSFQYPIFKWCREHRVHHKYMDTNADPYCAAKGFWFSHMFWLFQPRHPDCVKALKIIDTSDFVKDPIVRFQSKYYFQLVLVFAFLLPMSAYSYFLPELSLFQIFLLNMVRIGVTNHITFLVNSVAHIWGDKPYDKSISPTENKWVSFLSFGEGWHNYHHTFPWDYKTAELGTKLNWSTPFIHFFARIGWAWDLKTVSHKLLVDRINRTGDPSHPLHKGGHNSDKSFEDQSPEPPCWGWGDEGLSKEDVEITQTVFRAVSPRG